MSVRISFTRLRRNFLRCWEIGFSAALLLAAAGIAAQPAPAAADSTADLPDEPMQSAAQCGNIHSNTVVMIR
jgi:hypothetical protein